MKDKAKFRSPGVPPLSVTKLLAGTISMKFEFPGKETASLG